MSDERRGTQHDLAGGMPTVERIPMMVAPTSTVKGTAAGTAAGMGIGMFLMTLLQGRPELLDRVVGWGPGLFIVAGFLWLAHTYAPPFIETQKSTAAALQKLADTVDHSANSQHDLVLAMQVNSDKLEQVRSTVENLERKLAGEGGGG